MLARLWANLLALIFPPRCVGCGTDEALFCANCVASVPPLPHPTCPACHRPSASGATCPACRPTFPLSGLRVAAGYAASPALARAIKQLKYRFSVPLAASLGGLLAQNVTAKNFVGSRVVCAVPLHAARRRWRGFNQADLLAEVVAQRLALPHAQLLTRTKNTTPQAGLPRAARLQNLVGAFELARDANVAGQTVILVDDVASTGSTLAECARVLHAAGAAAVWGLVLARN